MRLPSLRLLLGLAILGSALLSAADGPTLKTSLTWKPTSAVLTTSTPVNLLPFAKQKIVVMPLVDKRAEKNLVGENTEKGYSRYVATDDNIADFVTKRLAALLAGARPEPDIYTTLLDRFDDRPFQFRRRFRRKHEIDIASNFTFRHGANVHA